MPTTMADTTNLTHQRMEEPILRLVSKKLDHHNNKLNVLFFHFDMIFKLTFCILFRIIKIQIIGN
jgi:hypothetical protein